MSAVELTTDERWAIQWSIDDQIDGGHEDHPTVSEVIKVLRNLLARATPDGEKQ